MPGTDAAAPYNPLVGNLSDLRKLVDKKFEGIEGTAVKRRRIVGKQPSKGLGYAVHAVHRKPAAAAAAVHRKPAAAGDDCWQVLQFTRKSGAQAGKNYWVFKSPDGKSFASLKQARLHGYTE